MEAAVSTVSWLSRSALLRTNATIAQELMNLWSSEEPACQEGEDLHGLSRAAASNLLVWLSRAVPGSEAFETELSELGRLHPARIIVMKRTNRRLAEKFRTHLAATARCRDSAHQVRAEQVRLDLSADIEGEALPPIINPLLIADVHTALLWVDALSPREPIARVLRSLSSIADSIIIDSALVGVDSGRSPWQTDEPAQDLNWFRIARWRNELAHWATLSGGTTAKLKSIEMETGRDNSQAALVTGWLASRLGWKFGGRRKTVDGQRWRFVSGSSQIEVRLFESSRQGGLRRLTILAPDRVVSIQRLDHGYLSIDSSGETLTARFAEPAFNDLLAHALSHRSADPIYLAACAIARQLLA
jgi:glucose-6-phosphate dehydrogenase assembly protein OpcA